MTTPAWAVRARFTPSNVALGAELDYRNVLAALTLQIGHTPSTYYAAEPASPSANGANASGQELWKHLQQAWYSVVDNNSDKSLSAQVTYTQPALSVPCSTSAGWRVRATRRKAMRDAICSMPRLPIVHTSGEMQGRILCAARERVADARLHRLGHRLSHLVGPGRCVRNRRDGYHGGHQRAVLCRHARAWGVPQAAMLVALFLVFDLAFFATNLVKLAHGGWFPLAIGVGLLAISTSWYVGAEAVRQHHSGLNRPLGKYIDELQEQAIVRSACDSRSDHGHARPTPWLSRKTPSPREPHGASRSSVRSTNGVCRVRARDRRPVRCLGYRRSATALIAQGVCAPLQGV